MAEVEQKEQESKQGSEKTEGDKKPEDSKSEGDKKEAPPDPAKEARKKKILWIVVPIVVVVILVGGVLWYLNARTYESTDDAQIDGHVNAVSARVSGHVLEVRVEETQVVNQGDLLVRMDPKDFEVAIAKAQADLADAVAGLQTSQTDVPITSVNTSSQLKNAEAGKTDASAGVAGAEKQLGAARARVITANANIRMAEANDVKAQKDLERYKLLVDKDEVSRQQYDQALAAAESAHATLQAQRAGLLEAEQNVIVAEHTVEQARAKVAQADASVQSAMNFPQQIAAVKAKARASQAKVEQQQAALEQAQLNLKYATIYAPVTGIVGKKSVEAGQNVSPGEQLMAVVPLEDIWVTANFKETQLKKMRAGQLVSIKVDAYGRKYSGKVERIAGASGARFSLLPPENATGNYVKVVQRIPIRIRLDPGQNDDHLLRPGMSVSPKVTVE